MALHDVRVVTSEPPASARSWPVRANQEFILLREEIAELTAQPPHPFNVVRGLRFSGPIDRSCLEEAVNRIIARHTALRAAMVRNPRMPFEDRVVQLKALAETGRFAVGCYVQSVVDVDPISVGHVTMTQGDASEIWPVLKQAGLEMFDPTKPPFMRATLMSAPADDHLLLLSTSHLVTDRWSMDVIERDLLRVYAAAVQAVPATLPTVATQFPEFCQQEHERLSVGGYDAALRYWADLWMRFGSDQLRFSDLQREPVMDPDASRATEAASMAIDADVTHRIRTMSQQMHVTPQVFFRACVMTALCHLSGRQRLALFGNFANRTPATADTVGWFQNRHITTIDLDGAPTVDELVAGARESLLNAIKHEAVAPMAVWNYLGRRLDHGEGVLPITLDYLVREEKSQAAGARALPNAVLTLRQPFLDLLVRDVTTRFEVAASYAPARFTRDTIDRILQRVVAYAHAMSERPSARVTELQRQ